jgi:cytidylate kinase
MKSIIVAIDGPSGAGKSSVGKMLARSLGALYIDSGAMYRAVAFLALEAGLNPSDTKAIADLAMRSHLALVGDPESLRVSVNGRDITEAIRTEEVTSASSVISAIPEVRRVLVQRQREMGNQGSVVMDGRDIGTVVFPEADFKFFLTARPEKRALRRFEEELERKRRVTYEETLADINTRDQRDSTRADSPLTAARDAIIIDSTNLTLNEVFERMLAEVVRVVGKQ